jgi:cytochrome c biogenesis protein ResB
MRKTIALTLLGGFLCIALFQPLGDVQAQDRRSSGQHITGTVIGIGGRLGGRSRQFTLIASSYTAPNQVRELTDALGRGGQDEMLRALNRMKAGRIQIGTGVGVTANVIIAERWGEGGTKLTVFYERNVSFYEMRYGTRSQDYPIGYAEIFLDQQGKGQGTLIAAARVRLKDGNTWEVEDFGTFPARLMGLRASGHVLPR